MGFSRRLLQQVVLGLLGVLPAAPLLSGGPEAVLATEDSADTASSAAAVWSEQHGQAKKPEAPGLKGGRSFAGRSEEARVESPLSQSHPQSSEGGSPLESEREDWSANGEDFVQRERDAQAEVAEEGGNDSLLANSRRSKRERAHLDFPAQPNSAPASEDAEAVNGEEDEEASSPLSSSREEKEEEEGEGERALIDDDLNNNHHNPTINGPSADDSSDGGGDEDFRGLTDLESLQSQSHVNPTDLGDESFVWELIKNGGSPLVEENVSIETAWDALVEVLTRRSLAQGHGLARPEPRMKKAVEHRGGQIETAALTMCGRRDADEDSLVVYAAPEDTHFSVRAIFDGHGGSFVSKFCAENLHRFLKGMDAPSAESLKDVFLRFDDAVLKHTEAYHEGSTGIVVLIEEIQRPREFLVYGREVLPNSETPPLLRVLEDLERDENEPSEEVRKLTLGGSVTPAYLLTVANVGDSRGTLLHREGGFTPLSADHKPSDPQEKTRVEAAGGFVASPPYSVPRIDNILALSRAFGDGAFKDNERLPPEEQKVVAVPDVRTFYALPGDVLMLACDGVYEPAEVDWVFAAHFVLTLLHELEDDLLEAAVKLAEHAFGSGSGDNISILLSKFGETGSSSLHQARTFMVDSNGEVLRENASPPETLVVGGDSEAELEELKGPMLAVDPKSPLTLK